MKLSAWAKKVGIGYQTAWLLFKQGHVPNSYQLGSGTIIVDEAPKTKKEYIVTYARVSSSENKPNLESQSKRLQKYCAAKGWIIDKNIMEIGSGLNDNRKKLTALLEEGKVTKIVVEHKDRLARFGVNYLHILCSHIGCEIIIINPTKGDKEDLISDFISIITSFCARIYGQRRKSRNTEKLIKDLESESVASKSVASNKSKPVRITY